MANIWEAIRENYVYLAKNVDMSMLSVLFQMEVLTDDDVDTLRAIDNPVSARHKLLRILYRKTSLKQQKFVVALEEYNQSHLADAIKESHKKIPQLQKGRVTPDRRDQRKAQQGSTPTER